MTWILPTTAPIIGTTPAQRAKRSRDLRYKARNPERVKASQKLQNERRKAQKAAWRAANRERIRQRDRELAHRYAANRNAHKRAAYARRKETA